MTDYPIIMSGLEILALLGGRKSQTRRLAWRDAILVRPQIVPTIWQRVRPGDKLWVREAAANIALPGYPEVIFYRADNDSRPGHATPPGTKWRRAIHMPRAWSRLTLVVTATKIERLLAITDDDCIAEGAPGPVGVGIIGARMVYPDPAKPWLAATVRNWFHTTWDTLHGGDSWDANPEVVALTFTVHKQTSTRWPRPHERSLAMLRADGSGSAMQNSAA